jgi:regulator of RNase E activity RraA
MNSYPISIEEMCERYRKLYTGAVSDVMDHNNMRNQALPYYIRPIRNDMVVVGTAFTGYGDAHNNIQENDNSKRIEMLSHIRPLNVQVWTANGDTSCAHWGGLMSTTTRQNDGIGAVIDGGVRDCDAISKMNFPVFAKFYSSCSSIGRWSIGDYQVLIKIGNTEIKPDDIVFGDIDGVVVIPSERAYDILREAEELIDRESNMDRELNTGKTLKEVYGRYGAL